MSEIILRLLSLIVNGLFFLLIGAVILFIACIILMGTGLLIKALIRWLMDLSETVKENKK